MIIFETQSPINGKIVVKWDLAFGKYIQVNGLTQSGGLLKEIWQETLKKLSNSNLQLSTCLILGLGGGSVATLVNKKWPKAKITGVDIDPIMVELGKKYLGLNKINIDTKIEDAYQFVESVREKYDLVLVDLYCGDKFPEKFGDEKFLMAVRRLLKKDGIAVFNRLYGSEARAGSMRFGRKLEKVFKKVDYMFPQANVELICYN